jgi:hypothetical protein
MNQPGQNLSDKQLKYSYWFLLRKKKIKQIGIFVLIAIDVLLIFWAVFGLVNYLVNYSELDDLATESPVYIDWETYHAENQPADLQIASTRAIKVSDNKTDIGVLVRNPNVEWGIEMLRYQFVLAGGQQTPIRETFFLPNEEKYLLELNANTIGSAASLQILDMDWERVGKNDNKILEMVISNEKFVSASNLDGQDLGGQANWRVENNSSLGYYDPGFIVVLFSGSREVAFNYMKLSSINSLSTRELTVSWGHKLPTITGIKVIPNINLFNTDIIK